MKKFYLLLSILSLFRFHIIANGSLALLTSTESDPNSFIDNCVNVINGDYCESVTDLTVKGPDVLYIQRYCNAKNYVTGEHTGCWRLFTTHFLVLGINPNEKPHTNTQHILAFAGERSGGILTYTGKRNIRGITDEPLKIDMANQNGMVNTYAKTMSGQTNHKNNQLHCRAQLCEIVLGDGTKRIYERVKVLPSLIFGEELIPHLVEKVISPEYYHLIEEILPSGNQIHFSYNEEGHLSCMEMKNSSKSKTLSWIHFDYEKRDHEYLVNLSTSDKKTLSYHFSLFFLPDGSTTFALTEVKGSHVFPCSYQYEINKSFCRPIKKFFTNKDFIEINYYNSGKVKELIKSENEKYTFIYQNNHTDVINSKGIKTKFLFNDNLFLNEIVKYDQENKVYRKDWNKLNAIKSQNHIPTIALIF